MYLSFLFPIMTAGYIFLISVLVGSLCLRCFRDYFGSGLFFLCCCTGIGLIILSNLILLMGMLGIFSTETTYFLFFILSIFSATQIKLIYPYIQNILGHIKVILKDPLAIIISVCILLSFLIILPNSFLPDVSYDVVEYHLGGVNEFIKAGKIFPIEGNFYTGLPFLNEMLFASGLLLEGIAIGGSPKFITLGFLILSCFSVFVLSGYVTKNITLRLGACLFLLTHPLIMMRIAVVAKNDMGVTAFVLLSFICWAEWRENQKKVFGILMGVFAGAAIGTKFTAVGVFVIPVILFLVPLIKALDENFQIKKILQNQLIVGGCTLLVFLPWMIKSTIFYGNPLFPLMSNLLPSDAFSAEQYEFYTKHLGAASILSKQFWQSAIGRFQHYWASWYFSGIGVWLIVVASIFILPIFRKQRLLGVALLATFLLGHLACNVLTANPNRFHAPLLPLLIFSCLIVFEELRKINEGMRFAPLIFFIFIVIDLRYMVPLIPTGSGYKYLTKQRGFESYESYRSKALGKPPGDAYTFANKNLEKESTVLLLYDARWYYFKQNVIGNTVYDRSSFVKLLRTSKAKTAKDFLSYLQQEKIDYLFVNEFELLRLIADATPMKMLYRRFPNFSKEGQLRDALRKKENHLQLVRMHDLYPPYQFDKLTKAEVQLLSDFFKLMQSRVMFETAQKPYPRIWITRIKN